MGVFRQAQHNDGLLLTTTPNDRCLVARRVSTVAVVYSARSRKQNKTLPGSGNIGVLLQYVQPGTSQFTRVKTEQPPQKI